MKEQLVEVCTMLIIVSIYLLISPGLIMKSRLHTINVLQFYSISFNVLIFVLVHIANINVRCFVAIDKLKLKYSERKKPTACIITANKYLCIDTYLSRCCHYDRTVFCSNGCNEIGRNQKIAFYCELFTLQPLHTSHGINILSINIQKKSERRRAWTRAKKGVLILACEWNGAAFSSLSVKIVWNFLFACARSVLSGNSLVSNGSPFRCLLLLIKKNVEQHIA